MHSYYYPQVGSTNDEAKQLIQRGAIRDAAYVLADEQTCGRGTRGRKWISPPGAGLYLSVVHTAQNTRWPITTAFTQSAAVACVEVLREAAGVPVVIRPVNDLMIAGRKLGGILTETVVAADRTEAVITGIGINIRSAPPLEGNHARATTCLWDHAPEFKADAVNIRELAARLAMRVDHRHRQVFAGEMTEIERLLAEHLDIDSTSADRSGP